MEIRKKGFKWSKAVRWRIIYDRKTNKSTWKVMSFHSKTTYIFCSEI